MPTITTLNPLHATAEVLLRLEKLKNKIARAKEELEHIPDSDPEARWAVAYQVAIYESGLWEMQMQFNRANELYAAKK
jgi:hypothetical protein